jgi:hypothetical protein
VQGDTEVVDTKKRINPDNGFAFPLQPDTDLGLAMLIAEGDDGQHQPLAVVGSISEGREAANADFRDRLRLTELGEDAGLCPVRYKIWARGLGGSYCIACEIDPLK